MIRAAELALFMAPVALFVAWRLLGLGRLIPTRTALVVLLAGLMMVGAGLAWSGLRERHPEGSAYVPAQLRDGQVVPGHGA